MTGTRSVIHGFWCLSVIAKRKAAQAFAGSQGKNANTFGSRSVKDDMALVFVTPDERAQSWCGASHIRIFSDQLEAMGQLITVTPRLRQAEHVDALDENLQQFRIGSLGQMIVSHSSELGRQLCARLPRRFQQRSSC